MADGQGDGNVPGGYFVGRPANYGEQPKAATNEPQPASTQTPGDYFVGRPASNNAQAQVQAEQQPRPPGSGTSQLSADKMRSGSFMDKWFSCFAGSGSAS